MKSRIPGPLCAHCGTGVVLDEPASSSSDSARTSATLPRITATPGPLGISDAGDPSVIAVAASPPTSASGRDGNNDVAHLAASLFRWLQRLAKGQIAVAKNGNFYTDVIVPSPVFNSTTRISDIDYLEPVTRSAVLAIIDDAKKDGIELMVFETYRSQALQQIYFERKKSKLKKVGVHHYGLACDIVKVKSGQPSWEGSFDFLGPLAKKHGLIWGGDWGSPGVKHDFVDADHVQRCPISMQKSLFAGTWYPDATYNPRPEADVKNG